MPVTPLAPPPPAADRSASGLTPRRAASSRQSNSVRATAWPLLTPSAYEALVRGQQAGTRPADEAHLRLRRLAYARSLLGQAKLALDACAHDHNPQRKRDGAAPTPQAQEALAPIYNRLRGLVERAEKLYLDMPLEVR